MSAAINAKGLEWCDRCKEWRQKVGTGTEPCIGGPGAPAELVSWRADGSPSPAAGRLPTSYQEAKG